MENSLLYSLGATAITLATAIPAGYGLAFGSFRGRKLILKLTLVVMLMPASTLVLPIFLELNALRLIGSIFSIILPFSFFPFGVYLAYIYYSTATRPAVALAALIAALPIAIVFVVSQRALVRGLVGGATKGERSRLRTEVISPSPSSRANRSASRRSVFTLSAAGLIFDGAATTQLIPAPAHARASRYPVGPASYTTRTGASSVFSHSTVSADPAGTRSDRTLPLPASITPATTDRACTCPTQLPSDIRRPRNCGSTAAPTATATRANLYSEAPALHTVWPMRRCRPSASRRATVRRQARRPSRPVVKQVEWLGA